MAKTEWKEVFTLNQEENRGILHANQAMNGFVHRAASLGIFQPFCVFHVQLCVRLILWHWHIGTI